MENDFVKDKIEMLLERQEEIEKELTELKVKVQSMEEKLNDISEDIFYLKQCEA